MVYKFPDDHRIDDSYDCRFGGGKDAAVYAPEDDQGDKQCPERFFERFGDLRESRTICHGFVIALPCSYIAD